MTRRTIRINLRTKLMALLLSISVLSVVITAYLTFLGSKHYFIESMEHSLEGITNAKSQTVENLMNDRVEEVERMAAYPNIVLNLETIIRERSSTDAVDGQTKEAVSAVAARETTTGPSAEETENGQQSQNRTDTVTKEGIFKESQQPEGKEKNKEVERSIEYKELNKILALIAGRGQKYEEIFILDTSGTVVASTLYDNEGKTASNAEFFTMGLKATFIQNTFLSEITKKLSMVIATPLKDDTGRALGVLGARLNLDALYQSIRDETGLGKTGETVVGRRVNNDVIFTSPTRYDDQAALSRTIPVGTGLAYPLQEASRGAEGSGFYEDYRGVATLAVWRPIPSLGWGLVCKIDSTEVLEPLAKARNWMIAVTLALLAIVVVLSHVLSKQIVKPIERLTQAADSISKGNTDINIAIKSQDEVGDLADSFERMVASIRFLSESEAEERQNV